MINREGILENRCNKLRAIIWELAHPDEKRLEQLITRYAVNGNLNHDDVIYLYESHQHPNDILSDKKPKKPPLGVMPRDTWDKKRKNDLGDAIERYICLEFLKSIFNIHESDVFRAIDVKLEREEALQKRLEMKKQGGRK